MDDVYTMHMLHEHEDDGGDWIAHVEPELNDDDDCMEMELAQAYVRMQPLESIFSPEESLRMGTVFPNLSMPYVSRWAD
jgi:hypothetical protein